MCFFAYIISQKGSKLQGKKHAEHCLTHLNKTACEIWSVSDKVHFWIKNLMPFFHRSLQFIWFSSQSSLACILTHQGNDSEKLTAKQENLPVLVWSPVISQPYLIKMPGFWPIFLNWSIYLDHKTSSYLDQASMVNNNLIFMLHNLSYHAIAELIWKDWKYLWLTPVMLLASTIEASLLSSSTLITRNSSGKFSSCWLSESPLTQKKNKSFT